MSSSVVKETGAQFTGMLASSVFETFASSVTMVEPCDDAGGEVSVRVSDGKAVSHWSSSRAIEQPSDDARHPSPDRAPRTASAVVLAETDNSSCVT